MKCKLSRISSITSRPRPRAGNTALIPTETVEGISDPRRSTALAVFLLTAALSHAQVERPLQWLQDLRDLQRGAGDPSTVANIRLDVETWLQVHPESKVTLAAAPPQPWDSGQIADQIKLLLATVEEIVKHQPAFDLGVTSVNISDTVSSLSPVADSIRCD